MGKASKKIESSENMNQPSISIIVPVYNVEPYVEDCIRSVMRQTYSGPMECIIVDDCGTDNSMVIVEKFVAEYDGPISFNILHHEHNRGLSAARNTGMDVATGDYLFFLDSDDELTIDCIEKLTAKVTEDIELEMVQGNAKSNPSKTPDIFNVQILSLQTSKNSEVRFCLFHHRQIIQNAWNKLIKRSFIVKNAVKFKEGMLYEDVLWTFFLLKHISRVSFIPEVTYIYRRRPNSIITSTDLKTSMASNKLLYSEILSNLTLGYEKEEMEYYTKRFTGIYINDKTTESEAIFHLFLEKAKKYCFVSCYRILLIAYLRRHSRLFRIIIFYIRRLRHPFLLSL